MRFPYAYYREHFYGPIQGESVKTEVLVLTANEVSDSEVDVYKYSQIEINTDTGDATILGFKNGTPGQLLFITNKSEGANKVIIKYNDTTVEQPVFNFGETDAYVEAHETLVLRLMDYNGISKWISLNQGKTEIGQGSESKPSLYLGGARNTGIYNYGLVGGIPTLGITANGLAKITFNQTINSLVQHRFSDGSASNPAITFISDPTSGFSRDISTGNIVWSMNGIQKGIFYLDGTFKNFKTVTTALRNNDPIDVLHEDTTDFTGLNILDLIVSNDPADRTNNHQVNGIYSKGDVKTDGEFIGTATSAEYADIAERYKTDQKLESGDIVEIGGPEEIILARNKYHVFGVISTNPAFKLNAKTSDSEYSPYVALAGRVPCKIIGKIKKGDTVILSDQPGIGQKYNGIDSELNPLMLIGYALEDKDKDEEEKVLIALRR